MDYRRSRYYTVVILILIALIHIYMKIYVKYLQTWPGPNQAIMDSLTLFNIQHVGALIFNILIGMVFGFENFWYHLKQKGKWSIDIKRLIIIGIPSLIFSIEFFHFYFLDNFLSVLTNMSTLHLIAPAREPFFRFLVGYTIITSIYKK